MMTDQLLTRADLAARLNLSVATIARRLKDGQLGIPVIYMPATGTRLHIRFDPRDVDAYLARGGSR